MSVRRALLAGVLAFAVLAFSASAASAVTIAPGGAIDAQATGLQTMSLLSNGLTYTCKWRLQGAITRTSIPLGAALVQIGRIQAATIDCNEPDVRVTPLVSPPSGVPGPWPIGLIPNSGVLGPLTAPTGMLVTVLAVRIRIDDPLNGFHCLFTGRLGLLIRNGANPQIQLLTSQFFATPVATDTCPVNLILYKFNGQYNLIPPQFIGP
jgi:hypothetical protein